MSPYLGDKSSCIRGNPSYEYMTVIGDLLLAGVSGLFSADQLDKLRSCLADGFIYHEKDGPVSTMRLKICCPKIASAIEFLIV